MAKTLDISFTVHVANHERYEAAEVYAEWLTREQIDEIKDAETDVMIVRDNGVTRIISKAEDQP